MKIFWASFAMMCCAVTAHGAPSDADESNPLYGQQSYKDTKTSVTVYVETDGQHLSAIDTGGKILWTKNLEKYGHYIWPDTDMNGKKTISPRADMIPKTVFIGPAETMDQERADIAGMRHTMKLTFNTTVFGLLNFENGDFFILGQD